MSSSTNTGRFLTAASCIPPPGRLGRWTASPNSTGSLTASWSSASLEFFFTGRKLVLCVGQGTERKDEENGGTRMLAVLTGSSRREALVDQRGWRVLDPRKGEEIVIFDTEEDSERTFVSIVLIDWASRVEVNGFIVDQGGKLEPDDSSLDGARIPKFLLIGDSITAGLAVPVSEGGEPLPFGTLNTFSFVAERILNASSGTASGESKSDTRRIEFSTISYPGFCLVQPTKEEKEGGQRNGMEESFFWDNPWSPNVDVKLEKVTPDVVIIELGTNDQSYDIPADRFGLAFVRLIKALKEWTSGSFSQVWLIPPFPDTDTTYREINHAMAGYPQLLADALGEGGESTIKFKLCDLPAGLTAADTVDGVHPRLCVHEDLGRKLAEFVRVEYFGSGV